MSHEGPPAPTLPGLPVSAGEPRPPLPTGDVKPPPPPPAAEPCITEGGEGSCRSVGVGPAPPLVEAAIEAADFSEAAPSRDERASLVLPVPLGIIIIARICRPRSCAKKEEKD